MAALLTRNITVDLFTPFQRERIRAEAVRLAAVGLDQLEIAQRLPEPATPAGVLGSGAGTEPHPVAGAPSIPRLHAIA
ncbi:MAG TPA: hypothetical protein VMZ71_15395 [Gemmataceae bacterium]|nr:hypothetical protein [Gemmataceae bacterium]